MRRLVTVIVVFVIALSSCTYTNPEPEARTYYDSLDLSSPTAAAETFVDAFARDDFMTVWLAFDSQAQWEWNNAFNLLHYSKLFRVNDEMRQGIPDTISRLITETTDPWYVFDQTMMLAREHNALLIDLQSIDLDMTTIKDDGTAVVTGRFEGIDGDVEIKLTATQDGRWKVGQVLLPGGDENSIPWGVVPAGD